MVEHFARSSEESSAPVVAPDSLGFWHRIQEHKILQWGLGYVGVAIAIAHGQELLADAFDWPHLIGRILMSVLVLGLPVVLTLAWYHGHKGLKRVGQGELTIIALLVLIGAGLLVVLVRSPGESSAEHRAGHALDSSVAPGTSAQAAAPVASPQRHLSSRPALCRHVAAARSGVLLRRAVGGAPEPAGTDQGPQGRRAHVELFIQRQE